MCAKLYRVGSGPVNAAEREMVNLLVEELPDDGYGVIPNVVLSEKGRHPYEYDAIIVAPHAIYNVEIKGWYGTVSAINRGRWRLSSRREVKNPLQVTDTKTKVLAGMLDKLRLKKRNGGHLRTPYVQSCLLAASEDTIFDVDERDRKLSFTPSQILTFIKNPHEVSVNVTRNQYKHCWNKIGRFIAGELEERDPTGKRYGSYIVEDVIERNDERAVFEGRHSQFDDNEVYRIRTWYVSPYRYDEEERNEKLEILRRSSEAMHRIGSHPNLVEFRDCGVEGDEFYEVTTWSDRGTLMSLISMGKNRQMSVQRKLEILLGIARGLEAAADVGVRHRNLSPEAILVGADGQPRIGEFDRAFVTDTNQTVYGALYESGRNEYLAPELRDRTDYESFTNSDLYSLGIIAFELFTSYLPSMNSGALEQSAEDIPEEIRTDILDFVERLRADEVTERPGTPADAVEELESMLAVLRGETVEDEVLEENEAEDIGDESSAPKDDEADDLDETVQRQLAGIFEPGERIDDSNTVDELLGEGAYSRVYAVRNDVLHSEFALKVADPQKTDDVEFPLREFGLMRDIGHPNVVRVEWAGKIRPEEGAPAYLLMERLDGRRLDEVIADGPVDADQAVEWAVQILDALQQIHPTDDAGKNEGILHRDIKPDNILIADRGAVLLDFSAAVPVEESGSAPVGTLRYSPPDLAEGGWDVTGDLFAVGCTLYEMVTGQSPWGEQAPSLDAEPIPIRKHLPGMDETMASVMDRAIASRREDRFGSAMQFIDRLESAGTRSRTQYNPTPHVSEAIEDAKNDIWTGDFFQQLSEAQHPQRLLYEALRSYAHREVPESDEDIERGFVDGEARSLVLERPLPSVAPSFYDALVSPTPPVFLKEGADPAIVEVNDDDLVLILDGIGYFEVAQMAGWAVAEGHQFREAVWTAGATKPGDGDEGLTALRGATAGMPQVEPTGGIDELSSVVGSAGAVRMELPRGQRGDDGLANLLMRRRRLVQQAFEKALKAAEGRLIVTSTWGVIYLGHGLRRDVGAGIGASADRVRALWSASFPNGRVGNCDQSLKSDVYRPYRDVRNPERGDRRFPVGRLAWPDPPDAHRLARGGMSLPERLLPLLLVR